MKTRFAAFLVLLLFALTGCMETPSPPPVISLSPPGWIQGTWYDAFELSSYTFTPDNVIWRRYETPGNPSEGSIDYRQQFAQAGITDKQYGTRWPTYELVSDTGRTIVKFVYWSEDEALFGNPHLSVTVPPTDSILYYPSN